MLLFGIRCCFLFIFIIILMLCHWLYFFQAKPNWCLSIVFTFHFRLFLSTSYVYLNGHYCDHFYLFIFVPLFWIYFYFVLFCFWRRVHTAFLFENVTVWLLYLDHKSFYCFSIHFLFVVCNSWDENLVLYEGLDLIEIYDGKLNLIFQ